MTASSPRPPAPTPRSGSPTVEYSVLLPEIILVVGALVLLAHRVAVAAHATAPGLYAGLTVVTGLGVARRAPPTSGTGSPTRARPPPSPSAIAVDGFSVFFLVLIACTVVLGALLGEAYVRREQLPAPEFFVLMLLSASGGMLMAAANDLIVLFLGLEILSIALYVLAGYHGRREASSEAAMKYFVLGAFSSAIFLYGIALIYGATGSDQPRRDRHLPRPRTSSPTTASCWPAWRSCWSASASRSRPCRSTRGRPTCTRARRRRSPASWPRRPRRPGFAGLLRVFFSAFGSEQLDWRPVVFVLAVLTLVVGSVLALVQTDIKRMLAYSSISHAGYVLVGLQAATDSGIAGSLFYLLAYTFMVLGSFAVVTLVGRRGDDRHSLDDYRGLAARRPGLALAFTVFLMAQAGVPFTSGFLAKFYVISAAVDRHSYALAIIAMLGAAVAAFFYLRVIVVMYGPPAEGDEQRAHPDPAHRRPSRWASPSPSPWSSASCPHR